MDSTNSSPVTRVLLPLADGALPLTVARAGGDGAALVIMPSAFGIGPDLEAQMVELAAAARLVVALDPFFRGDGGLLGYDEIGRAMARLMALDPAAGDRDLAAAIGWSRAQAAGGPLVVLGICFGGPFVLRAAAAGLVDGVASWHGTGMEYALDGAAATRCPLRLHFGGRDGFVPPASVAMVRAAFAGHADADVVVHDGAAHGYTQRLAAGYDGDAERASLAALRRLLGATAA